MHIGKTLTTAVLLALGGTLAPASAATVQLPPPGAHYAYPGDWCASLNEPKGGREGTIHEWVWKDRDGVLHCEYAGARKVRS